MALETSILKTIKQMLGIEPSVTHFDEEIKVGINSAFADLHQLGVGPDDAFVIIDDQATWAQFIGSVKNIDSVKTYVYLSVRLVFDVPTTSFVIQSFEKRKEELGWRLNVELEGVRHPL